MRGETDEILFRWHGFDTIKPPAAFSAPFFLFPAEAGRKHLEARRPGRMAERKRWVPSDQAKNLLETIFTADSFPTCANRRPHPPPFAMSVSWKHRPPMESR